MRVGTRITKYKTLNELIDDTKFSNNLHYFYIIKTPHCGGERIKVGKSANMKSRAKYYQAYWHATERVQLLELRSFSKIPAERFTSSGKMIYAVFEDEVKKELKNFNKEKTKNEEGKITEWFDKDKTKQIIDTYNLFMSKWEAMEIEPTAKKESLKREGKIKPSGFYKEKKIDPLPKK